MYTRSLLAAAALFFYAFYANAAPISNEIQTILPYSVQQLIVIDYPAAKDANVLPLLRNNILPQNVISLQSALENPVLNVEQNVRQIVFADFPSSDDGELQSIGLASGQFPVTTITSEFHKNKITGVQIDGMTAYPLSNTGQVVVFLDQTALLFGTPQAVFTALMSRNGTDRNYLSNVSMQNMSVPVQNSPIWCVMDAHSTNSLVMYALGRASQVVNFGALKNRVLGSRYTLDFTDTVKFDMSLLAADQASATAISTVLKAAIIYQRAAAMEKEKEAFSRATASSNDNIVTIDFTASAKEFKSITESEFFHSLLK